MPLQTSKRLERNNNRISTSRKRPTTGNQRRRNSESPSKKNGDRQRMKAVIHFRSTEIDPPFEENKPFTSYYAFLDGHSAEDFDLELICPNCKWSGTPDKAKQEEATIEEHETRLICPDCKSGLTTTENTYKVVRIQDSKSQDSTK